MELLPAWTKALLDSVTLGDAMSADEATREQVIRNEWHVVYRSADLAEGEIRAVRLLGEDLVLWRTDGRVMAWLDRCIHRGRALYDGPDSKRRDGLPLPRLAV